jgi:hypothetical protein
VDEGEAPVRPDVVQHPRHRPRPERRAHLLDLGHLFGQMHVHRPVRRQRHEIGDRLGRHRPQGMRRHADPAIVRQRLQHRGRGGVQPGEAVAVGAEADLPGAERAAVAAAELVMHRQEREPDPGPRRGGGDPPGHLGRVVVGPAAGAVVQVVEFDVGRIARLQHLHLHEGGDRLDMVGRQPVEKAEHQLAPGPERVARIRPPPFGQPRHRPLEGVAVGVRRRGKKDVDDMVRGPRHARLNRRDPPRSVQRDPHIFGPACPGQGLRGPECRHRRSPLDG